MSTLNISLDEYLKVMNGDVANWSAVNIPAPTLTESQMKAIMGDKVIEIDPRSVEGFEAKAKALKEKVEQAISNVLILYPTGLYHRIISNCVLSGSSISSLYHSEPVKDFDLWCKDIHVLSTMEKEIPEKYSNQIMEYDEKDSYGNLTGKKQNQKIITNNAITMTGKVQLITLSTYDILRKQFDFVHCMPYYDLSEKKFYISPHQLECIAKKKLELNPDAKKPLEWRIEKFKNRGWAF